MVRVEMKIMGDPSFIGDHYAEPIKVLGDGKIQKVERVGSYGGNVWDEQQGAFDLDQGEPIDRGYGGDRPQGKGSPFRDLWSAYPGGGITHREGYDLSNLFDDQGNHFGRGLDAIGGGETGSG